MASIHFIIVSVIALFLYPVAMTVSAPEDNALAVRRGHAVQARQWVMAKYWIECVETYAIIADQAGGFASI
jgi:uncharacterized membrane protein YhaH (DUF805 family)